MSSVFSLIKPVCWLDNDVKSSFDDVERHSHKEQRGEYILDVSVIHDIVFCNPFLKLSNGHFLVHLKRVHLEFIVSKVGKKSEDCFDLVLKVLSDCFGVIICVDHNEGAFNQNLINQI